MAKKNITLTQEELNAIIAGAVAQALAQAPTKSAVSKAKGKAQAKLVEFTKADGTVVQCTEAQAKAWDAYRNRKSGLSLDEVKALKPQISAKGKAFVKANPGCTRKEAAANGCKNITKEGLKALKVELGVR